MATRKTNPNPIDTNPAGIATATPPVAASPDPFNPDAFRLTSTADAGFGVKRKLVKLPVRKPAKQEFFRTHPELVLPAAALEFKEDGSSFMVLPAIAATIPGETKPVELTLCVTRQGAAFVWPVPMPVDRDSPWTTTAREAAASARDNWVRMVADMPSGMYNLYLAEACNVDPVWPEVRDLRHMLELAYGMANIVTDHQHPALARLRGE